MNPENALVKRQVELEKGFLIPAGILSYLFMCEELKDKTKNIRIKKNTCINTLPFVSEITEKATPQGLVDSKLYF